MIRYKPGETIVGFDAPGKLMSLNDRTHYHPKAKLTKAWREAAREAAEGIEEHAPSIVTLELPVRDRRRRDPHNYVLTMKAVIDGITDAGAWPDDNSDHVYTREPVLVLDKTAPGFVTIRLTPLKAAA
jgi:hypothetical protein